MRTSVLPKLAAHLLIASLIGSLPALAAEPKLHLELGFPCDVTSTRLTADGKRALAADCTGNVKLWDIASGREIMALPPLYNFLDYQPITRLSPNGKLALAANKEAGVKLFDLHSGTALGTHPQARPPAEFTPDGKYVLTGSWEEGLLVWDPVTARTVRRLALPDWGFEKLAVSPDSHYALTDDNTLHHLLLWDLASGKLLRRFKGHTESIISLGFSPDGKQLVSGANDDTIRVWDRDTGKQVRVLRDFNDLIYQVRFLDKQRIMNAGALLTVWDIPSGRKLAQRFDERFDGEFSDVSADGRTLISSSSDGFRLWDLGTFKPLARIGGKVNPIAAQAFAPDAGLAALAFYKSDQIELKDLRRGSRLRTLDSTLDAIKVLALDAAGKRLLAASPQGELRLFDAQTGKLLRPFGAKSENAWVNAVKLSPDGKWALVTPATDQGTPSQPGLQLWNLESGSKKLITGNFSTFEIQSGFTPDSKQIWASIEDGKLQFWDLASGKPGQALNADPELLTILPTSQDRKVLTKASQSELLLWDLSSGTRIQAAILQDQTFAERFEGSIFEPYVRFVDLSDDGQSFLLGFSDDKIEIWNTATHKRQCTLSGHQSSIRSAWFSADGQRVYSGSEDGTIRLWNPATGQEIAQMASFGEESSWIVFTSAGYFDAPSRDAASYISLSQGMQVSGIDKHLDTLYRPDLVARILAGESVPAPVLD